MDLEGWTNSKKVETAVQVMGSGQVEQEEEIIAKEAEESLEEGEAKRDDPPAMRKSKKRKLERGESSNNLENPSIHQEDLSICLEDPCILLEEDKSMESLTQKNITKLART